MGNSETFITIHDQDILLNCEESGQFQELSSYKYLFVGPKPVDKLPKDLLEKTIVCRNYTPNYEDIPHLYDFTGWYVLAKHGLMTKDYAICLQYDHTILNPTFEAMCIALLFKNPGMVSFVKAYRRDYILNIPGFADSMRAALGVKGLSMDHLPLDEWPTTQGTAWRSEALTDFMMWCEGAFETMRHEKYAGHIAERMVVAYSALTHPPQYLIGYTHHQAADCHGTGAAMVGKESVYQEKALTFGK